METCVQKIPQVSTVEPKPFWLNLQRHAHVATQPFFQKRSTILKSRNQPTVRIDLKLRSPVPTPERLQWGRGYVEIQYQPEAAMSPPQTYRLAQVLGTGAYVSRLCWFPS